MPIQNTPTFYHRSQVIHRSKPAIMFGLVIMLCGSVAIALGLFDGYKSLQIVTDGKKATATISQVKRTQKTDSKGKTKRHYSALLTFTTESGDTISVVKNEQFTEGEVLPVVYLSSDPSQVRVDSFSSLWGGCIAFTLFGLLFSGFGIWIARSAVKRQREIAYLRLHGKTFTATIVGVNSHTSRTHSNSENRRFTTHRYEIIAQYQDDAQILRRVKSDSMKNDPGDVVGQQIEVLVDPQNSDRYYVVTE